MSPGPNRPGAARLPQALEGVEWFVAAEPVEVGREQIEEFLAQVGVNNRPVQPLNDRVVIIEP